MLLCNFIAIYGKENKNLRTKSASSGGKKIEDEGAERKSERRDKFVCPSAGLNGMNYEI